MRKYGFLVVFILLALVVAGCATATPVAPAATPVPAPPTEEAAAPAPVSASDYAGTYSASLPAADSPGRTVTAVLAEDGAVQVTSDYQNGQPPIVETGTWQPNADGGITVTLTEQDGQAYFEPQVVPVMRDAATGELVITGADGVAVRMAPGSIEPQTPVEPSGCSPSGYVRLLWDLHAVQPRRRCPDFRGRRGWRHPGNHHLSRGRAAQRR